MDITFTNGSEEQQGIARAVFGNFLHLNLDDFSLDLEVEFIVDPGPQGHNEFAFTDVGDGTAVMSIRTDFPRFNPVHIWGSTQFANEVVAHEAGHALLGQLSIGAQEAIAEMFDTTPDNWSPENAAWEDRPLEGIIETFKDAFYPNHLREFFNRTNHRIPIDEYPEFRSLWRAGVAEDGALDPVTGDPAISVPAYNLDTLLVNLSHSAVTVKNLNGTAYNPYNPIGWTFGAIYSTANYTPVANPNTGLASYRSLFWAAVRPIFEALSYTGANARSGEQSQPPSVGIWLEEGKLLDQSIPFPGLEFFEYDSISSLPFTGVIDKTDLDDSGDPYVIDAGDEVGNVSWGAYIVTTYFDTSIGAARVWDDFVGGYSIVAIGSPPDHTKLMRWGDCEGIGPGVTIERQVTIPTADELTFSDLAAETCGVLLIPVRVFGGLFTEGEVNGTPGFELADYPDWLPSMPLVQPAHAPCPSADEIPAGEMAPGPGVRGQIKAPHRVMGHTRTESAP